NRKGSATLSDRAIGVAGRHDWYYDKDIIATRGKPGPGTYDYKVGSEEPCMRFGTSKRPPIYHISSRGHPGPGQRSSHDTEDKYGGALTVVNE
ncbi:hypothetical protein Pmar_PMAR005056, partial [Perkinsus marinus ATCC 50983]